MGTNTSGLRPPWRPGESGRSHARRPIITRKSIMDQRVTTLEARVNYLTAEVALLRKPHAFTIEELENELRKLGVEVEIVNDDPPLSPDPEVLKAAARARGWR